LEELVKIKDIRIVRARFPDRRPKTAARREAWGASDEVANPMSRYPHVKRHRGMWLPKFDTAYVQVTAENGVWGLGPLWPAQALVPVIAHFNEQLIGQDCFASEHLADMMFRLTKPYGTVGLASYAISGVDLALWDLKGKLVGQPAYSLLGGPARDKLFCYSTGNDVDWYQELGFRAFKLACPYGPADGLDGLHKNVEFVAKTRSQIGDSCELMLDCWMAFDVEYTVRLAETLRPYRLKWIEEYLVPEDLDGHVQVRQRLPWQTLATGEHWYTHYPFQWAIQNRVADILQPDIMWCGGASTLLKIAAAADAGGTSVIIHGGGNNVYGQHFSYSSAVTPWLECFVGTPVGVPLEECWGMPGQAVPKDGWLVPSDAPGFGLEVSESMLEPYA
jgi:L-rhamnonate dehydratase